MVTRSHDDAIVTGAVRESLESHWDPGLGVRDWWRRFGLPRDPESSKGLPFPEVPKA